MDFRCPACGQIVLIKITAQVDPNELQAKLSKHQTRCIKRVKPA